jgi:gamma-glutamyl phosphate reductase
MAGEQATKIREQLDGLGYASGDVEADIIAALDEVIARRTALVGLANGDDMAQTKAALIAADLALDTARLTGVDVVDPAVTIAVPVMAVQRLATEVRTRYPWLAPRT